MAKPADSPPWADIKSLIELHCAVNLHMGGTGIRVQNLELSPSTGLDPAGPPSQPSACQPGWLFELPLHLLQLVFWHLTVAALLRLGLSSRCAS